MVSGTFLKFSSIIPVGINVIEYAKQVKCEFYQHRWVPLNVTRYGVLHKKLLIIIIKMVSGAPKPLNLSKTLPKFAV